MSKKKKEIDWSPKAPAAKFDFLEDKEESMVTDSTTEWWSQIRKASTAKPKAKESKTTSPPKKNTIGDVTDGSTPKKANRPVKPKKVQNLKAQKVGVQPKQSSSGIDTIWQAAAVSKAKKPKEKQVWLDAELCNQLDLLNLKLGKPANLKHLVNGIMKMYIDDHEKDFEKTTML